MRTIPKGVLAMCGVVAVVMGVTGSASAQVPDEFTNLKILDKGIGKRDLMDIMRSFSGALGVRCDFCHVPGDVPGSLEGFDFASDEPKHKEVARGMMKMSGEINSKLLPAAGLKSPMRVRCVTCHRGVAEPASLSDRLTARAEKEDASAAVSLYRELRDEYYGSGSYDFSAKSLNEVAENVAKTGDMEGAITVMKLNVEMNPDSAYSHLVLGQLYMQSGKQDEAIRSVELAIELEPDNERATRVLERMKARK